MTWLISLSCSQKLSDVHDVFNVSQFKKCLRVPKEQLALEELDVRNDLTYEEIPIKILETAKKITRSKTIRMCSGSIILSQVEASF